MKRLTIAIVGLAAIAALAFLLAGCSLAPGGDKVEKAVVTVIDAATADRKAYNDTKGDVLLTLPCDISIGAYYRIDNVVKQEALQMLCSGKRIGDPAPTLGTGLAAGAAPAAVPSP